MLLKGEVENLNNRLNEQTDRSLRSHLTFIGIPQAPEETTWDDTTLVLTKWLEKHKSMSEAVIYENIIRCHRGPKSTDGKTPFVECGFTWKAADGIFKELGAVITDGVNVIQKFSKGTQERRNQALIRRKTLRNGVGKDWKMF